MCSGFLIFDDCDMCRVYMTLKCLPHNLHNFLIYRKTNAKITINQLFIKPFMQEEWDRKTISVGWQVTSWKNAIIVGKSEKIPLHGNCPDRLSIVHCKRLLPWNLLYIGSVLINVFFCLSDFVLFANFSYILGFQQRQN